MSHTLCPSWSPNLWLGLSRIIAIQIILIKIGIHFWFIIMPKVYILWWRPIYAFSFLVIRNLVLELLKYLIWSCLFVKIISMNQIPGQSHYITVRGTAVTPLIQNTSVALPPHPTAPQVCDPHWILLYDLWSYITILGRGYVTRNIQIPFWKLHLSVKSASNTEQRCTEDWPISSQG